MDYGLELINSKISVRMQALSSFVLSIPTEYCKYVFINTQNTCCTIHTPNTILVHTPLIN